MKRHLSTKELSILLSKSGINISPKTLYNWKSKGCLPLDPVPIAGRVYFLQEDAIDWVNSHGNHKKISGRVKH